MARFLKYIAIFAVAVVVMQLLVFDSMRVWIYFSPLAYVAFIVLLPLGMKPIAVLFLGFATGLFVDFFEGTAGLHTAATVLTSYLRRPIMGLTLGREATEDSADMPSPKTLGVGRFIRYASLMVFLHCLVFFSLETLTWRGYLGVVIKTIVSGAVTLAAVWAVALLFTIKTRRRR